MISESGVKTYSACCDKSFELNVSFTVCVKVGLLVYIIVYNDTRTYKYTALVDEEPKFTSKNYKSLSTADKTTLS